MESRVEISVKAIDAISYSCPYVMVPFLKQKFDNIDFFNTCPYFCNNLHAVYQVQEYNIYF